jgi:hypothetical protein
VHRDRQGYIRVISAEPSYDRLVRRSFEKIRQSSLGMPAVMIRELDALAAIMAETTGDGQRRVLLEQAAMIDRACERSVPEADDRADVRRSYEAFLAMEPRPLARLDVAEQVSRLAFEGGAQGTQGAEPDGLRVPVLEQRQVHHADTDQAGQLHQRHASVRQQLVEVHQDRPVTHTVP